MTSALTVTDTSILVVEDEYLLANDLANDLADQGARVIGPVATLGEAIERFEKEPPDLAVLDINLRGELVFPLADMLSERHVPYVFTTGYDVGMIPARFASVPCHEKPIRAGEVIQSLARLGASWKEVGARD